MTVAHGAVRMRQFNSGYKRAKYVMGTMSCRRLASWPQGKVAVEDRGYEWYAGM
jgi:hypothetical protein